MTPPLPRPPDSPARDDFRTPRRRRLPATVPTLSLSFMLVVLAAAPVSAQYRFGVSVFGASMVALVGEYRWAHQGLEVQAGTWRFRDLSLSVTARQYVGSRSLEPFVGAGLWAIAARQEEGTGFGLVARFPVGLGWDFGSRHNAALTVHLNRALAVRRPGPDEGRPLRTSLVPLPEFSYRWWRN